MWPGDGDLSSSFHPLARFPRPLLEVDAALRPHPAGLAKRQECCSAQLAGQERLFILCCRERPRQSGGFGCWQPLDLKTPRSPLNQSRLMARALRRQGRWRGGATPPCPTFHAMCL